MATDKGTDAADAGATCGAVTEGELLPCVRCGGLAHRHENDWCSPPEYAVHCYNNVQCGIFLGGFKTQAEADAAWNWRAPQAARTAGVSSNPDTKEAQ